jgi:hypothetical protein
LPMATSQLFEGLFCRGILGNKTSHRPISPRRTEVKRSYIDDAAAIRVVGCFERVPRNETNDHALSFSG